MEFIAAFGWVALVWWTWPALFAVCTLGMWFGMWLGYRENAKDVRPCLAHLGTGQSGFEWWCMLRSGHAGPHRDQWGDDPDEDPDESWEDEDE